MLIKYTLYKNIDSVYITWTKSGTSNVLFLRSTYYKDKLVAFTHIFYAKNAFPIKVIHIHLWYSSLIIVTLSNFIVFHQPHLREGIAGCSLKIYKDKAQTSCLFAPFLSNTILIISLILNTMFFSVYIITDKWNVKIF